MTTPFNKEMYRQLQEHEGKLVNLEANQRYHEERLRFMEESVAKHMRDEAESMSALSREFSEIRREINRYKWAATGAIVSISTIWIFSKDIIRLYLQLQGG